MKIYFAGPLCTMAERSWNSLISAELRTRGHEVFLPQDEEHGDTDAAIFLSDKHGLDWADVVVAVMDGPDADSGTCWECGYAVGQGTPVVTVRTDFRRITDSNPINLMMSESAEANLWITDRLMTSICLVDMLQAELFRLARTASC